MGFFDKVKNMFTEEIEDEVKVEKIQKEVTHVTIDSPKKEEYDLDNDFDIDEPLVIEKEEKFSKPVFFDDKDFSDLNLNFEEEPKRIEKDLYGIKKEEKQEEKKEEKKIFKPTPIISPVYGVLDKNYHKEDIVSRSEYAKEEVVVEPSIDSIRNKAYGTLEDELENTLFGNNSILFKQVSKEIEEPESEVELEKIDDDVLTNLTDDISKELDELLTKKEKYIEEEEKTEELNEDLLDFIDSTLYKDGDEE